MSKIKRERKTTTEPAIRKRQFLPADGKSLNCIILVHTTKPDPKHTEVERLPIQSFRSLPSMPHRAILWHLAPAQSRGNVQSQSKNPETQWSLQVHGTSQNQSLNINFYLTLKRTACHLFQLMQNTILANHYSCHCWPHANVRKCNSLQTRSGTCKADSHFSC